MNNLIFNNEDFYIIQDGIGVGDMIRFKTLNNDFSDFSDELSSLFEVVEIMKFNQYKEKYKDSFPSFNIKIYIKINRDENPLVAILGNDGAVALNTCVK